MCIWDLLLSPLFSANLLSVCQVQVTATEDTTENTLQDLFCALRKRPPPLFFSCFCLLEVADTLAEQCKDAGDIAVFFLSLLLNAAERVVAAYYV